MRQITPFERKRLALEALMSERTVQKAYLFPMRVRESTRLRLVRAAVRLGIEPPIVGNPGGLS
jgi:hypothetical protein